MILTVGPVVVGHDDNVLKGSEMTAIVSGQRSSTELERTTVYPEQYCSASGCRVGYSGGIVWCRGIDVQVEAVF